ncbi:protein MAIN-LIKE 2-like [Lolium perenne]|uniref:protein MAIN-LIKE 2-like n=1 Tax=Lolium perenne TaxID=4522 RepID=UPI003A9A5D04
MAGRSLLNRDIERAHRAAKLEANPNSLSPMVTRGGNQNWQIHPGWVQRLKWAGLLPFARLVEATRSEVIGERVGTPIKRLQQDHSLLTNLVDRWRPKTHTFHFRWGEMAPTLQDVSFLLGLPLAGQPIGPLAEPVLWDQEMSARFEGTRAGQTEFLCEDHGPKCDWLLNFEVSQFTPPMSEAQITRSLEAYILWLLGKVMFTENHQTTISRRFIPIALEIAEAQTADDIIQRSWGSAVLASTYRAVVLGEVPDWSARHRCSAVRGKRVG